MQYFRLLFPMAVFAISSCASRETGKEAVVFYPALSVIRNETQALDSLPMAVIRYRESGATHDTSIVEKPDFKRMAVLAFSPDISKPPLKRLYKEEVFMDRTLNRVVIRYGTERPDVEIRTLEITLDPESEKVRSLYLERQTRSGDTVRTVKSVWTVGREWRTSVVGRVGDKPLPLVKERYLWGLPQ